MTDPSAPRPALPEREHLWLSPPILPNNWIAACDPGRTGGAVIIRGDRIYLAAQWKPAQDGKTSLQVWTDIEPGDDFIGPHGCQLTKRAVPEHEAFALPWLSAAGALGVIEQITPHEGKLSHYTALAMAVGALRQSMLMRGVRDLKEVPFATWVADVLACPGHLSDQAARAAYLDQPMERSRRWLHWPRLSGVVIPETWGHALDALGMALWRQGRRVTRKRPEDLPP